MLQFQSTPASYCFADNPIIYQLVLSGEAVRTFQRIRLDATFTLSATSNSATPSTFSTQLMAAAQPGVPVSFNLSDAAQTLFKHHMATLSPSATHVIEQGIQQTLQVTAHEVYFDRGQEVVDKGISAVEIHIIPGGQTEYSRFITSPMTLQGVKHLTNKPDGEVVYMGQEFLLPIFVGAVQAVGVLSVNVGQTRIAEVDYSPSSGSTTVGVTVPDSPDISNNTPAVIRYAGPEIHPGFPVTLRRSTSSIHHLRFVNSFGMLESISVESLESLRYEQDSETFSLVSAAASLRPNPHRYLRKSAPVASLELSSGYVSLDWANWYIGELLSAPRAWLLVDGRWLPGVIEANDKLTVYNRAKPELIHVDFTFTAAVDGVGSFGRF